MLLQKPTEMAAVLRSKTKKDDYATFVEGFSKLLEMVSGGSVNEWVDLTDNGCGLETGLAPFPRMDLGAQIGPFVVVLGDGRRSLGHLHLHRDAKHDRA